MKRKKIEQSAISYAVFVLCARHSIQIVSAFSNINRWPSTPEQQQQQQQPHCNSVCNRPTAYGQCLYNVQVKCVICTHLYRNQTRYSIKTSAWSAEKWSNTDFCTPADMICFLSAFHFFMFVNHLNWEFFPFSSKRLWVTIITYAVQNILPFCFEDWCISREKKVACTVWSEQIEYASALWLVLLPN